MKCGWCDRDDELRTIEVEPAQYVKRYEYIPATGETELVDVLTKMPVLAMACPEHRNIVFDPSPNVRKIRRRRARGFQQSTIFDQLPEEKAEEFKDRSALHEGTR